MKPLQKYGCQNALTQTVSYFLHHSLRSNSTHDSGLLRGSLRKAPPRLHVFLINQGQHLGPIHQVHQASTCWERAQACLEQHPQNMGRFKGKTSTSACVKPPGLVESHQDALNFLKN